MHVVGLGQLLGNKYAYGKDDGLMDMYAYEKDDGLDGYECLWK